MKALVRILLGAVLVVAALLALLAGLTETSEVVTLTSVDDAGAFHETSLWVVDYEGSVYLRAGTADAGWLARVRTRPLALLERGGEQHQVRLVVDPARTPEINAAMGLKYGFADMFLGALMSRDRAVAVRVTGG